MFSQHNLGWLKHRQNPVINTQAADSNIARPKCVTIWPPLGGAQNWSYTQNGSLWSLYAPETNILIELGPGFTLPDKSKAIQL